MKIRIKNNSVRLRLTKTEVEKLKTIGHYEEQTEFGEATFVYRLERYDAQELNASFKNNCITIYMPIKDAKEWYDIDKVGYSNEIELPNGSTLNILIEKDFVCLDETVEDQSDNYPHPLENQL
jgi:hypothetical protein